MLNRLRRDENLHRAFISIGSHEVIDGILFVAVALSASVTWGLLAWAASFLASVVIGHWAIELHDKLDKLPTFGLEDIEE